LQIRFLGAAREVTGSCFLVTTGRHRLLLDCGLIQGAPADEARNREPFAFEPAALDAVILSHAHLDHSGRLPLLVKQGFRGPIYTHRASRDLCRVMLRDAATLNERDAEIENRKRDRKGLKRVEPLYGSGEVDAAMRRFRALDYDQPLDILPGVRLTLRDAGHILGSAIVELRAAGNGGARTVVFSGDLGHRGAPILRDPALVRHADLVMLESTYGDRNHRGWDDTWRELGEVFDVAARDKGNILVPAFAVGRTQELLYVFQRHYRDWGLDRWQIFLDSPMAIEATELYARHARLFDREATELNHRHRGNAFQLPNLHLSRTPGQSMAINRIQSGAIVIAGSGMCDGGRIRHHLKHNVWRESCHLLFTGFQARGTLGRRLVDGAPHVRLWGETVRVAARIHTIGGLSAHADQQGLLDWYRAFEKRPRVALVHGEPVAMETLAARLRAIPDVRVTIPQAVESIDIA
jgi:metallo-beta-lactamase family protein